MPVADDLFSNMNHLEYETPKVEMLVIAVEKGFQGSEDSGKGITAPGWDII